MNKFLVLFLAVVLVAAGCKRKDTPGYTVLGDYTPWGSIPEKLTGKVEKMIERVYWGEVNGDSIVQGKMITSRNADSLGWGYAFEVNYNNTGDLLGCLVFNEKNRYVGDWQFFKKNNMLDSAVGRWRDTLNVYQKLKCNDKGMITGASQYRSKLNTLMSSWTKSISRTGDTIEYQYFNCEGVLSSRNISSYNEKGQFVSSVTYDKDGAIAGSLEVAYNETGKVSGFTFFDKDKKATDIVQRTYGYDTRGNWTRMISKNNHGEIAIYERTYTYFQ